MKALMKESKEQEIKKILLKCGIMPSKKGFSYIVRTVEYYNARGGEICMIYEKVAEHFGVKPENVERCIRYVIMEACAKGTLERINDILGVCVIDSGDYLSNLDFISILSMIAEAPIVRLNAQENGKRAACEG